MNDKRKQPVLYRLVQSIGNTLQARSWRRLMSTGLATLLAAVPAWADPAALPSNRLDVGLQATVTETLSISFPSSTVAFGSVAPGSANAAPANQALSISSSWVLVAGRTVKLYAYFDSASSAMTGTSNGDQIPTSAVSASLNGGAQQTFTQTSPFTSGSTAMLLYSVPISVSNAILNGRADSLALSLNLAGLALHADNYTGTMHLQMQAL